MDREDIEDEEAFRRIEGMGQEKKREEKETKDGERRKLCVPKLFSIS